MKTSAYNLVLVALLGLLLGGCNRNRVNMDEIPVNPYVEAFTSGNVSRYSAINIVFSEDIPEAKSSVEELGKNIRISPSVEGTFSLENKRTVVFKPKEEFKPNTDYKVSVDVDEWFPAKGKDKKFVFGFVTLPFAIRSYFTALDVNKENANAYDITCTLLTPDKETPERVEKSVHVSETVNQQWQHTPDGKHHELTLRGVPSRDKAYELVVKAKKTDKKTDDLSINVPVLNEFSVYDVRYVSEQERYIEVTFTKNLDPQQSLEGLVSMGGSDENVGVRDNKVRLYPEANKTGTVVVNISAAVRSATGATLGDNVTRNVSVGGNLPTVQFVGNGVVVPFSKETMVPFQAAHVRGVVVRILKIREQNIGQFLQVNNLDGNDELVRVGRLVTRKVIFLDEDPTNDLTHLNTYALDLRELVNLELGAIYRVELSFDRNLSVTPCDSGSVKLSKAQILAENEEKFKKEDERYDSGEYYYYGGYYDDDDDDNDPCKEGFYRNKKVSKNVLASNLGLMVKGGNDGTMDVFVHNLLSTDAEQGVAVKLYNYQGQVLGEGKTQSDGHVAISVRKGMPFYLIASKGKQRAYVRMDKGSALSLSSFDTSGEVVQRGIKGFIYGDRGVWRPGDMLYMSFMLNDRAGVLPKGHPVVMELINPMGQLYLKKTCVESTLGVYTFNLPTESNAPTGSWTAKVSVGGVEFSKRVRIESIKPNRLKINITSADKTLLKGRPMNGKMHVEWLQGATARNLKYDIQGTFTAVTTTFKGFDGFCFDDPAKTFSSEEGNLITGHTDENGNATLTPTFDTGSSAPGMLTANFTTKVYEESGDFSIDASTLLYSPYASYAGIKSPQKDESPLSTGENHTYQIAAVNYAGNPLANKMLNVNIYKVDWYWWWSSDNSNLVNFISNSYNQPVKNLTVMTDGRGRGSFDLSFTDDEWVSYFIQVQDSTSKHTTGVLSYFDWPLAGRRNTTGAESATMLRFKTDKDNYAPDEKINVTFPSSNGSRAIVTVENGSRVLSILEHECESNETTISLKATEEMQPNAYVSVTLLQPHAQTKNDLPIRLYGVVPINVTSAGSHLLPQITMANEIKPEGNYTVSVSEKNGQEMAYTLAVVDEGLLDLTHFKTPDPWGTFNAREALGVSTWDMYNYVVGAYGGRIEQIFSIGGDGALNRAPKAIVNRFEPVVKFEGPFLLKKGQTAKHTYAMPNYYGRVRVMVVAGNGKAYGNAEKSVLVRKPVMVLGTLPRIIGIGEEMAVPATIFATEKDVGVVRLSISCSDNMQVVGESTKTLLFEQKEDKTFPFRIRVKGKTGAGHVKIVATGKNETSTYETDIEIRSVRHAQTKVEDITLGKGRLWKNTVELPGADGTNKLSLEVSSVEPLNLSKRLSFLLGYPYGCIEQITSKAFPQIYLNQFVTLTSAQKQSAEAAVKACINKQRSYQTAEGGFSYWPGETSTNAWGTVYAAHFLREAETHGYYVPADMKRNVVSNMSRIARSWKPVKSYYGRSEELTQAYRLYVLALMNAPEMGAMNRLKETGGTLSQTRWMLASAYSVVGRNDVAKTLGTQTRSTNIYNEYDQTFGSELRDKAIILQALVAQNRGNEAATLARQISKTFASDEWLSTQETAYGLSAMSQYLSRYAKGDVSFNYTLNGKAEEVSTNKTMWLKTLVEKAAPHQNVALTNKSQATLFVRLVSEGVPEQGKEKAYAYGISISAIYTDMTGKPLNVDNLRQGTNFKVAVTVKNNGTTSCNRLALTQVFPSGWEILNTRFLRETSDDGQSKNGIGYQDIRDDRVYSFIDRLGIGQQVTVRLNLCAAYAGSFYLPPVDCEAMYNHLIRANTEGHWVKVHP